MEQLSANKYKKELATYIEERVRWIDDPDIDSEDSLLSRSRRENLVKEARGNALIEFVMLGYISKKQARSIRSRLNSSADKGTKSQEIKPLKAPIFRLAAAFATLTGGTVYFINTIINTGYGEEIRPGQTISANAGDIIEGDVKVGEQPIYDDRRESGLVVKMGVMGYVTAPWGARLIRGETGAGNKLLKRSVDNVQNHGCGISGGCTVTNVVFYPGKTQKEIASNK